MLRTPMRDFMFYMTDTRYSTPTWFAAVLSDESRARAMAASRLAESAFHTAIECTENGRVLFRLPGDAESA